MYGNPHLFGMVSLRDPFFLKANRDQPKVYGIYHVWKKQFHMSNEQFSTVFSTCIEPMGLSRPAEFHLLDWISEFLPNNCLRLYSTVQKVSKDSVVSMAWIILILGSNYVVVCSKSMNLCISNSPTGSMYGIFT